MTYNQSEFDIRFEWGVRGVEELAPISDVVIIVDIFSFSTSVDIALNNGAIVFPFDPDNSTASEYSKSVDGILAEKIRNNSGKFSLSPSSLTNIPENTRLVLPSLNGSALSLLTGNTLTSCGCLRNAKSVAEYAMTIGNKISIIASGEKWEDNTLRPAFEDLLGAGSIISYLKGELSPESKTGLSIFLASKNNLKEELQKCISGKELIAANFENDVELASDFNVSSCVPGMVNGAYVDLTKKI
ncbi:MAG: 2-phosphosulfolactate phosphatase [Ignavibacteria bacterium]|nr:2-phosphosulfolactate phosphatase [Ignavibacteria bacterium]